LKINFEQASLVDIGPEIESKRKKIFQEKQINQNAQPILLISWKSLAGKFTI